MENKSKELKMGLNAQKSFAQMHEDRNMNKEIEGQMVELDPVVAQEPREEKQIRKPQSPFQIRNKRNDFARILIRTILTQGRTPLDDGFLQQKSSRN